MCGYASDDMTRNWEQVTGRLKVCTFIVICISVSTSHACDINGHLSGQCLNQVSANNCMMDTIDGSFRQGVARPKGRIMRGGLDMISTLHMLSCGC